MREKKKERIAILEVQVESLTEEVAFLRKWVANHHHAQQVLPTDPSKFVEPSGSPTVISCTWDPATGWTSS